MRKYFFFSLQLEVEMFPGPTSPHLFRHSDSHSIEGAASLLRGRSDGVHVVYGTVEDKSVPEGLN